MNSDNGCGPDWASPTGVRKEYANSASIDARLDFYRQFGDRGGQWYERLFDVLPLAAGTRVLDVGCGGGTLWMRNANRCAADVRVVIGDASPGIVSIARRRLCVCKFFEAAAAMKVERLPFRDKSFDVVVAAHLLYHVADRRKGLLEVNRVLVKGGHIVATTIGSTHLAELAELLGDFRDEYRHSRVGPTNLFIDDLVAEVGAHFSVALVYHWKENLIVRDAAALVDFLMATHLRDMLICDKERLRNYFENFIMRRGAVRLATHSGAVVGVNKNNISRSDASYDDGKK
jgi:ubiquinone/menaquinone biosynthesis C-methylase UbiE